VAATEAHEGNRDQGNEMKCCSVFIRITTTRNESRSQRETCLSSYSGIKAVPGLVKRVVEACPIAATKRYHRGLLPIQMALGTSNQGWNEDFQALLDANPLSLMEAFELDDAIYSHLLARITLPNTIYEIVRSKPTVVTKGARY
jgi:hypothetical protein